MYNTASMDPMPVYALGVDVASSQTRRNELDMSIKLPDHWTMEPWGQGSLITAPFGSSQNGFVTVDERKRNFVLGARPVRTQGEYAGRSWRQRLFQDAIDELQNAIDAGMAAGGLDAHSEP